jgi:hypothetical protein
MIGSNNRDHQHLPYCKSCQTLGFIYYLAWCLDKLAQGDKLPAYYNRSLSTARIRDRTYGCIKCKSKIHFRIWRHYNAWRESDIFPMEIVLEKWTFDLEELTLIKQ